MKKNHKRGVKNIVNNFENKFQMKMITATTDGMAVERLTDVNQTRTKTNKSKCNTQKKSASLIIFKKHISLKNKNHLFFFVLSKAS